MAGVDRDLLAQLQHILRPLANKVRNVIARGVVQLVDDAKKQQMLQLGVLSDEPVPDGEHFHPYGFSSVPLPGAEVVVAFPGADRSHPLVIAVSDRRHRPTGGEPGEVTMYNNAGASMTMTKDGDIIGRPAPGQKFLISDTGGGTEPVVTQSEFLNHGHATAATGPVSPPMMAPAPASAALFPGTTSFEAK